MTSLQPSVSILIYSHSDYNFVWPAMVGQFNYYVTDLDVYFLVDSSYRAENSIIPPKWYVITYEESKIWTKRLVGGLESIDSDYVLFIHEDWLPVNSVSGDILREMVRVMSHQNWDFLLSYSHYSVVERQAGIYSGHPGYFFYKEDSHIFQPAIWKKTVLLEFARTLNKHKNQNEDQQCLSFMRNKSCYSVQNASTVRKFRTTNSLFSPTCTP